MVIQAGSRVKHTHTLFTSHADQINLHRLQRENDGKIHFQSSIDRLVRIFISTKLKWQFWLISIWQTVTSRLCTTEKWVGSWASKATPILFFLSWTPFLRDFSSCSRLLFLVVLSSKEFNVLYSHLMIMKTSSTHWCRTTHTISGSGNSESSWSTERVCVCGP